MGMYDTINGEQVKCFGWYSYAIGPLLGNTKVDYHGGSLDGFVSGDTVPSKRLFYNYSPNFMILDTSPENEDYAFIIHIIKNNRVLVTVQMTKDGHNLYQQNHQSPDKNLEQYFYTNNHVIGYYGEPFLRIQSMDDAHAYFDDITKLRMDLNNATPVSQELWKEYHKLTHGIGLLDTKSEEYKSRKTAIAKNRILFHHATKNEEPIVKTLQKEFADKWYFPNPNTESQTLGKWIDAGQSLLKQLKNTNDYENFCKDFKTAFPVLYDSMIEDYHTWYDSSPKERHEINQLLYKFTHSLT